MTRIKTYFHRICLLLIGPVVALLLAEGLVRTFYPHSRDHVIPAGFFEIDNDLGWKLQAQKSATHHSRYFRTVYSTNALGYRDKPRIISKGDNLYRCLLYGDSQVFGWGLPADQRFSNLIEAQSASLEIWNLATPGYGLDQQIISYEKHGGQFKADEVIFFVSKSTIERNRHRYIFKKYKPKFFTDKTGNLRVTPVPDQGNQLVKVVYKILSPFYLPYFLERRFAILKRASSTSANAHPQKSEAEHVVLQALDKSMIQRVKEISVARNHRMTILAHLTEADRHNLKNFCKSVAVDFVGVDIGRGNDSLAIGKHDRHWNAQAHQLIAAQLRFLLKRQTVKKSW